MTTAIYALSGDPITYGHIDIISRSAKAFEKLIVALGVNPNKNYLLTSDERLAVAKQSLSHLSNVEVILFSGLLVDTAFEQNAQFIVKGIRNSVDMGYEQTLDQINSTQMEIDTFLMFSKSKLTHVSSSSVKAIQLEHGLIQEYVPLPVKKLLEKKISHQFLVGVTGVMGSGKSYIAEKLVKYSEGKELKVFNIDLDSLANGIYSSDKPAHVLVRQKIEERFGTLDRKEISKIVFDPIIKKGKNEHLNFLNDVFREPVKVLLRKELNDKKGIVLINSAILVESDLLDLCNNHVILVNADDEIRHKRLLEKRFIDPLVAEERIKHTHSYDTKKSIINKEISKSHFGNLFKIDNNEDSDLIDKDIQILYNQLVENY
jgi:pantetheine-phosphate adenylyltransferase